MKTKTCMIRTVGWVNSAAVEYQENNRPVEVTWKQRGRTQSQAFELTPDALRRQFITTLLDEIGGEYWHGWVHVWNPAPSPEPVETRQEPLSGIRFSLKDLNELASTVHRSRSKQASAALLRSQRA